MKLMQPRVNTKVSFTILSRNRELFKAFDYRKESVDLFLGQFPHRNEQYNFMWKVMAFVFTLPHGQSQIERGFNINKEIMIENMSTESVKAQRMIFDTMKAKKMSPDCLEITNEMRRSCLTASSKRKAALEEAKKKKIKSQKEVQLESLRNQRKEVMSQVKDVNTTNIELEKQADDCYDQAETPGADIQLLVAKGNGMRKTAIEKKKLIDE